MLCEGYVRHCCTCVGRTTCEGLTPAPATAAYQVLMQYPLYVRDEIPVVLSGELGVTKDLREVLLAGIMNGTRPPPPPL